MGDNSRHWRGRGRPEIDEQQHQEAWERYIEAERREVEMRKEGHLARILGGPLPGESQQELVRLADTDQMRAWEGLVELMDESGEIIYKHIDELTPEDRTARVRAEGARIEWITQRQARRYPSA